MIVDDFYVVCVPILPVKTNSPLVVDPDAVLSGPLSSQRFQAISRHGSQVSEGTRRLKVIELSLGYPGDLMKLATELAPENLSLFPGSGRCVSQL